LVNFASLFRLTEWQRLNTQKNELTMNDMNDLGKYIRNVPDFPVKGIRFKDITTLLKDPFALHELSEILVETYKNHGITKVVGIESRGLV
jgi:adenine/guanine phosphoribosyltransferase-like PRPP-binding protein